MIGRLAGCAMAIAAALGPVSAQSVPERAERVVAIDWGLAETLIAIGAPPLGLSEIPGYRDWVTVPDVPPDTAEIGLRATPSLEFIAGLDADVILSTPQFASITPVLEKVAPVLTLEIYTDALEPYRNAVDVTRRIGRLVGRQDAAEDLIEETADSIAEVTEALAGDDTKKVLIINFNDDLHVRVFGEGSIYDDVLERAGLENAWTAPGNFWGFEQVSVDQLVGLEDAAILIVEPVPPSISIKLPQKGGASLIAQMALFEEGRYRILPAVWGFGGLPSAARFAEVLMDHIDFLKAGHDG